MTDEWIPVDELLPPENSLVMVWTDWQPIRPANLWHPALRLNTGFIDETGGWNIGYVGSLRAKNSSGLFPAISVLFWSLLPSAPVGCQYPVFRSGILPMQSGATP